MQYFAWRSREWALGRGTACTIFSVLVALSVVHALTVPSPIAHRLSAVLDNPHWRPQIVPGPSPTVAAASAPVIGARIGEFRFTMYYVAVEPEPAPVTMPDQVDPASGGPGTITLYSKKDCAPLAVVDRAFGKILDLQGTGKLKDGRVVNTAGSCRCPHSPCYAEIKAAWAMGPRDRLTPFRAVAIDTRVVKLGSLLYVQELDGLRMPGKAPWGGFVHDGCVIASDRGGGIRGRELDFFVAKKIYVDSLYRRTKMRKVTVFDGKGRCERAAEGRVRKIRTGSI